MTQKRYTEIPKRQKCINKEEPYIGGAKDLIDDELQLTQEQINAIVLGDAVSVSLAATPSPVFVGVQSTINLTATSSVAADTITIKKGDTVIATGTNKTSQAATDSLTPIEGNNAYSAQFAIGGLTKNSSKNVVGVYPIYYGAGAAYTAATTKASARTSPAGTYNVTVPNDSDYVFFVVPATMTINRASMSGFDFPLQAPVDVTIDGVAYNSYQSSNTYDAGSLTIVIS